MAFCVQSDLEIALGGASVLAELADPTGTGTADADTVTDYIESVAGQIRSVIEVKYDPETIANLDADSLRLLRDINKWGSARVAWLEGGRGQAMPQHIADQADRCDGWLTEIRTGERRLGRVAGGKVAAINQPVGILDYDPTASKVSIAGFKLGFR